MYLWHAVLSGVATLEDLETTWSLDDLARGLAAVAIKGEIESRVIDYLTPKVSKDA